MRRRARQGAGLLLQDLHVVVLGLAVASCASVDTVLLTVETFPPKDSVSDVQAFEQEPARPHIQIAELSISSTWLSVERMRQKILEKAATLGADAVVFSKPETQPLAQSDSLVGYDRVSSGSRLKEDGRVGPDGVSPSANYESVPDEVTVVLVRAGGGGHGGGSHGGAMRGGPRGRSAPFSARPWGRYYAPYYGPGYWGYGMYGPGGWGYAPFWGGYDPFWGDYPPFGGGYALYTVLSGTAIRYTEPRGP